MAVVVFRVTVLVLVLAFRDRFRVHDDGVGLYARDVFRVHGVAHGVSHHRLSHGLSLGGAHRASHGASLGVAHGVGLPAPCCSK